MKLVGLFVLVCAAGVAQPFSAGLKVGGPLTSAISLVSGGSPDSNATSGDYVIGPYAQVNLPGRFAVEVDALYRNFSYTAEGALGSSFSGSNGQWEFPVMAKYKLLPGPVKPYVEGGLVLSHLTGSDVDISHAANYGVTLGAGVEIHALFLRLMPEVRYDGFFFHDFSSNSLVQSNRNQVMVLVGIGF